MRSIGDNYAQISRYMDCLPWPNTTMLTFCYRKSYKSNIINNSLLSLYQPLKIQNLGELFDFLLFNIALSSLSFNRVHSHAAAALINFCEGVERDTLLPYLDPIVQRLLKLLNPDADPTQVRKYVQEQVITTLAMVADASEVTFAKVS